MFPTRLTSLQLALVVPLASMVACKAPTKPSANESVTNSASTPSIPTSSSATETSAPAKEAALLVALRTHKAPLEHVAGKGGPLPDGQTAWQEEFEGGLAVEVGFSQPYGVGIDDAGNLYVADKNGHAIRKVFTDGHLETIAGTKQNGNGGDSPAKATEVALGSPNGIVTRGDGTSYILDKDNSKIRKLSSDGTLSTLATLTEKVESGRGLWVSADESTAYVSSKERLLAWNAKDGTTTLAKGFASIANLAVGPDKTIYATDRGAHLVLEISPQGIVRTLAGNGDTQGGKSGDPALQVGLAGARGLALASDGSLWIGNQESRTVWWISPDRLAYKIIDGISGDGLIACAPELFGPIRGLALTNKHQLLIVHGDGGQIHRVELPKVPSSLPVVIL